MVDFMPLRYAWHWNTSMKMVLFTVIWNWTTLCWLWMVTSRLLIMVFARRICGMDQPPALSVVLLNSWLLRYGLCLLIHDLCWRVVDLAGQEVWPCGRLVGIWCSHLPDASPTIALPWWGWRWNLWCYSCRWTFIPNPHASRFRLHPSEAAHQGAWSTPRKWTYWRSRNYESAVLQKYQLGRCIPQENTAAIPASDHECYGYQQLRFWVHERYSSAHTSTVRWVFISSI